MKSVNVLIASAGLVAAQLTADIASISSAVGVLNSQVSGFSEFAQASAIVDTSNQIVSIINKGTSDAKSGGQIAVQDATGLLQPFMDLQSAVSAAVGNLVNRKAVATSLSLGNVVEAQLVSQLAAASAFAAAVEAQLPSVVASLGSSLAGAILSDLSSGSAAFSGLSGPSTLGSGPASTPASSTASSSVPTSSGAASSSVASTGSSTLVSSAAPTSSAATSSVPSSNVTSPSSTPSIAPSTGAADKTVAGFVGMAAAAFIAMIAL